MKASVIVFPGSNCDRDIRVALEGSGAKVKMVWHAEKKLPKSDLIVIPGGFSYGDYLRCGSMAAHSPIMREVISFGKKGGHILGICNGFQVLTETQLLPGALMRNRGLNFICRDVSLKPENTDTVFTGGYKDKKVVRIPISHHDGNYFLPKDEIKKLEDNGQIAFRYASKKGEVSDRANPNGSAGNIAGVFNKKKNILGLMPHPERLWEKPLGGTHGRLMFESLVSGL